MVVFHAFQEAIEISQYQRVVGHVLVQMLEEIERCRWRINVAVDLVAMPVVVVDVLYSFYYARYLQPLRSADVINLRHRLKVRQEILHQLVLNWFSDLLQRLFSTFKISLYIHHSLSCKFSIFISVKPIMWHVVEYFHSNNKALLLYFLIEI